MSLQMAFISGAGAATFGIYGWQIFIELIRHKSMLEYPYSIIPKEWFIFAIVGLIAWVVGGVLS